MGGVERAELMNTMEATYCCQQPYINASPPPSIEEVRSQWPYLFHFKSIFTHFQLLTDINVLRSLELSMDQSGRSIIEYFNKSNDKNVKAVFSQSHAEDVEVAHFKENTEGLLFFAYVSNLFFSAHLQLSFLN